MVKRNKQSSPTHCTAAQVFLKEEEEKKHKTKKKTKTKKKSQDDKTIYLIYLNQRNKIFLYSFDHSPCFGFLFGFILFLSRSLFHLIEQSIIFNCIESSLCKTHSSDQFSSFIISRHMIQRSPYLSHMLIIIQFIHAH